VCDWLSRWAIGSTYRASVYLSRFCLGLFFALFAARSRIKRAERARTVLWNTRDFSERLLRIGLATFLIRRRLLSLSTFCFSSVSRPKGMPEWRNHWYYWIEILFELALQNWKSFYMLKYTHTNESRDTGLRLNLNIRVFNSVKPIRRKFVPVMPVILSLRHSFRENISAIVKVYNALKCYLSERESGL